MEIDSTYEEFDKYILKYHTNDPEMGWGKDCGDFCSLDSSVYLPILQDFEISSCVSDTESRIFKLKVTPLYKTMRDVINYFQLLNLLEPDSIMEFLVETAVENINILTMIIPRKIIAVLDSDLGETFEYCDRYFKILSIGEKVSENPDVYAIHNEGTDCETHHVITREVSTENDIISITYHHKMKLNLKKIMAKFICEQPSLVIRYDNKSKISSEFIGTQVIKHVSSMARVELTYTKSIQETIIPYVQGKIFNEDNSLYGTLEGNFLTSLILKKSENEKLWDRKKDYDRSNDACDFAKFLKETLESNIEKLCLTDSRHKIKAKQIKDAEIDHESKTDKMLMERSEKRVTKDNYEPKWFRVVFDNNTDQKWYQYTRKYWRDKLSQTCE